MKKAAIIIIAISCIAFAGYWVYSVANAPTDVEMMEHQRKVLWIN